MLFSNMDGWVIPHLYTISFYNSWTGYNEYSASKILSLTFWDTIPFPLLITLYVARKGSIYEASALLK